MNETVIDPNVAAQRDAELAAQREAFKNETLERGSAFEETIRTKGWTFIKAFHENTIRAFTNKAILNGYTTIEEFNLDRGKVLGMLQLFNEMDSALKTLEDERARNQTTTIAK